MEWDVRFDDGFTAWFDGLAEALQDEILAHIALLRSAGRISAGPTSIPWRAPQSRT